MMLNGLQTSTKALPLDGLAAKLQSMDAETTGPVSFGELLKLKEKQLQQEQEVSASFIAATFASLQTSQFIAALSIQNVEIGETVTGTEVSKASTDAISQTVTTPIEGSDQLPLAKSPAQHASVTESIPSMFPVVFNSVNENTFPLALAKPELSDALLPNSFGKTTTSPNTNFPIPGQPVQFTEQVLTADVAKITSAKGQVLASIPSPNSDATSARDAIKPAEPAAENHVSTVSTTAKASLPSFNNGITTKNDVAEENIKTNTSTVPQAARNLEISTQIFPVNSAPSEDKISEGTFSSIDPASNTVVMPNEEGGIKDNDFLISDGTKSNNSEAALLSSSPLPVSPNREAGTAPSSLPAVTVVDRQESDLHILDAPVASQSTKAQSTETSKTSEYGNESGFVQPEIKESIHFCQTVQKDNNTASRPLPVKTTEGVPTRNTPTETDNSTIQQFDTTYRGQQLKSSAPEILATSSFSPNAVESEKMEKPITSQIEDEINAGVLHFDSTVDEIISTPEIEPVDNPIGEPTIKQKIAVATNVDPESVEVATTNSKVELPNNLNSHHGIEMSSTGNHIQGQEFSVRLDQPGSQDVKTQVEQSSFGKVGTEETKYSQTIQLPVVDDAPLADEQAGFNSISASERTVEKFSDTQGKIDLKNRSQGSAGRVEVMADPEKGSPAISNPYKSNTTTQILSTESEDAPFEAGETTSPIETTSSPPMMVSSDRLSASTEDVLPNMQFSVGSQEMEGSKTKVAEKVDSIALENSWVETGTIQTSDQPEAVKVFNTTTDVSDIASTKSARVLNSGEPLITPTQSGITLETDPEKEVFNQQDIIFQPGKDLSPVATKSEKNIPLASETVAKKITIPIENSEIQEKNPANLSSGLVVPTMPEFIDGEAGISLHTSLVAEEVLQSGFNPDATSNIQSFQSITGSAGPQTNQRQIEVEIPLSEQLVAEPSEIPASDFEIDTQKIAAEPNVEEQIQGTEPNLSNPGAAWKFEMPDVDTATVMMDLQDIEDVNSQGRYVESDKTADLTGHVLSNTYTAEGNKNVEVEVLPGQESSISSDMSSETSQVAENQSNIVFTQADINVIEKIHFANIESPLRVPENRAPMPEEVMRTSAKDDSSKSSTDEDTSEQPTQVAKTPETVPQVVGEPLSQSEVTKAVEAKNGETQIHVQLPMDQSAQNGTIQFHEDKSKSDVEVKPEGFKSPSVGADEKINTRTESINGVRPASHQAPGVVEIINDPIAPALPNAHTVNGPDVNRKPKQIENDEKTLPVEKQPRLNQPPEIAAPANGPVRETTATYPGGNVPSNQLPGDVKEVVDHVIRHINSNLKNGPTSMRLQLSPRELGAIDVQMVSDSQGVHVTFFAEQASTGKLLETQLDQLRISLLDSGVHLSGLDIGQHNQSGQKGGSFDQSPNFTRDFSRNFPDAQTVSQEKPSLERSLGRSTDIDYLI
jgi:hypothetical protein